MIPLVRPALLEPLRDKAAEQASFLTAEPPQEGSGCLESAGGLACAAREDSNAPLTRFGEWASPWLPPIARRSSL